jgi:hypothetical protein
MEMKGVEVEEDVVEEEVEVVVEEDRLLFVKQVV